MPLRLVRRIGEVERALIHEQYRRNVQFGILLKMTLRVMNVL